MRLIDADAFDKVLKDAQLECKKNGGNFRYGVLATVRANLEKAPTVSGWVSMKDRLPNCNGIYLVWRPHYYGGEIGEPVVCYFDGQNTWHDSYGVDFGRILHPDDITHWMPLPEPPEEVSGDA